MALSKLKKDIVNQLQLHVPYEISLIEQSS